MTEHEVLVSVGSGPSLAIPISFDCDDPCKIDPPYRLAEFQYVVTARGERAEDLRKVPVGARGTYTTTSSDGKVEHVPVEVFAVEPFGVDGLRVRSRRSE